MSRHILAVLTLFVCLTACAGTPCRPDRGTKAPDQNRRPPGDQGTASSETLAQSREVIAWFPRIDAAILGASPHVDFIPGLRGYQQTTEYTCGPAALLSLAKFYGVPGINEDRETEMRIAKEANAHDPEALEPGQKPGTRPEDMSSWLRKNGFEVRLEYEGKGDLSALEKLRDNIKAGIPTLVEWIDLGGHWVVAVGYDDRGTTDPADDILIFADPYDRYDDHRDGYTFVNAERFYWMWFDARLFDGLTWRTMITAVPGPAADHWENYFDRSRFSFTNS